MFSIDTDFDGIVRQRAALEAALSTDPKTAARLRRQIRSVILDARRAVEQSVRGGMAADPRRSATAVRTSVYKRLLGANINILSPRRAHAPQAYEPPRRLQPGQRGGNRVPRSPRTDRAMHYAGQDRGFVLRFLNGGTAPRTTRLGFRGAVPARRIFTPAARQALERAAQRLATLIDTQLTDTFKS